MSVVINNSLDDGITWDAYNPDDGSYIASLKGTTVAAKGQYFWDAENDANVGFGWNRSLGFQLRIKLANGAGTEVVKPSKSTLFHVDDNLIVVKENNQYSVRTFRNPAVVISSPAAGAQLGESRHGRPDTLVVDWQMNDVAIMGWTYNYVSRATASLRVKQAGFPDEVIDMAQDGINSTDSLTRYRLARVFPRPGNLQLIGQILTSITDSSPPVNVTVTGSGTRVLDASFANARSGSSPPAIGFTQQGGTIFVTLTAPRQETYKNVRFTSTLTSGWLAATPWPGPVGTPPPNQGWTVRLPVGVDAHPAAHVLTVEETDGFGTPTSHPFNFAIEDIGLPVITIVTPTEDYPFVPSALPLTVTVSGTVNDTQTGYKPGSLLFSFGSQSNVPVAVDGAGRWSFNVQAADYGPYSVTLTAQDQALPNANSCTSTRQFKLVRSLQIQTLDELLSTRSYLDELLRFIRTHLVDGNNSFLNSAVLTASFVQPFGALAQPGNPTADQVTSDLLLPVRLLRASLTGLTASALQHALVPYLHNAYETLLRGLGTSFEELRTLAMMSATTRRTLADRLGLRTALGDDLAILLNPNYQVSFTAGGTGTTPPQAVSVRAHIRHGKTVRAYVRAKQDHSLANNFGPSRTAAELTQPLVRDADHDGIPNYADPDDDNDGIPDDADPTQYAPNFGDEERWLQTTFGLPSTADAVGILAVPGGQTRLLVAQRSALQQQWTATDSDPNRRPDLDPDLVNGDDLAPSAAAWQTLLQQRAAELDTMFQSLINAVLASDAVALVMAANMQQSLKTLAQQDHAGENITDAIANLRLDLPMFRRLIGYLTLIDAQTLLSGYEREDLAHLLLEIWKRWTRLDTWRQVEDQTMIGKLWPTLVDAGAWVVGGGYRRDFAPWRATASRRSALEARLVARFRAWDELSATLDRAVFDAQRAALPLLRDKLLGLANPPVTDSDILTERWLVDVESTGVSLISPVKQAVSSLQTLINGVRSRWFTSGHPAQNWKIKDSLAAQFDDEWKWLESEERWRSAVNNFMYPENVLFPELRTANSPAFQTFLASLRSQQPLTHEAVNAIDTTGLAFVEKEYFAPLAIALAFQRAGLHSVALDVYRTVYDVSRPVVKDNTTPANGRKRPSILRLEDDALVPAPDFDADDYWTLKLSDPHTVALATTGNRRVFGNPYTRFTLMQIARCALAAADADYAAGTVDSLNRARGGYLEVKAILALPELADHAPTTPGQVYIVNHALSALRDHVSSNLRKLRHGLSFLGTPLPPDLTRGAVSGTLSSLVRPTPYRFKVLLDRARQLVAIAQQFESQYLAAIEHNEAELEKALREGFAAQIASQTVTLRQLGVTEAETGEKLALAQQTRSQIEQERYQGWLSAGENLFERQQMDALQASQVWRQVANVADTAAAAAQAAQTASGLIELVTSAGAKAVIAAGIASAVATKGIAQGFVIAKESEAQTAGIYASQARRQDEWQLRADIARQDIAIGGEQRTLAENRTAVANQELAIAHLANSQSQQMLSFLREKFTSAAFYDWLKGVLGETYGFFLRLAAATAQQAELQLAFERQEQPQRLIRADYWAAASQNGGSDAPDRRGITGSARLMQDIYTLDQQAFSSERRLLNLSQSFSLARLMPVEFESLRHTGQLTFATPMAWFDEGFPGHYMRLIKRVRLTVVALIPPTTGIRASLSNSGLSRVVTGDVGFPTTVIRQDPQAVALTSSIAASGVFELDSQAELLQPFEGMGVDSAWTLEIPRAGNSFDFDSLTDVVLTLEYTALGSQELRERVVKTLPQRQSGDRVFSLRLDFPDIWYDICNGTGSSVSVTIPIAKRAFPGGLADVRINEMAVSIQDLANKPAEFSVALGIGSQTAAATQAVIGLASSRQSGGASWHGLIDGLGLVSDAATSWTFTLSDVANPSSPTTPSFIAQLRAGEIGDVLLLATFSGARPTW